MIEWTSHSFFPQYGQRVVAAVKLAVDGCLDLILGLSFHYSDSTMCKIIENQTSARPRLVDCSSVNIEKKILPNIYVRFVQISV